MLPGKQPRLARRREQRSDRIGRDAIRLDDRGKVERPVLGRPWQVEDRLRTTLTDDLRKVTRTLQQTLAAFRERRWTLLQDDEVPILTVQREQRIAGGVVIIELVILVGDRYAVTGGQSTGDRELRNCTRKIMGVDQTTADEGDFGGVIR